MLTLKIVYPNGQRHIREAEQITVMSDRTILLMTTGPSGCGDEIKLNPEDVAYIVNSNGKTVETLNSTIAAPLRGPSMVLGLGEAASR